MVPTLSMRCQLISFIICQFFVLFYFPFCRFPVEPKNFKTPASVCLLSSEYRSINLGKPHLSTREHLVHPIISNFIPPVGTALSECHPHNSKYPKFSRTPSRANPYRNPTVPYSGRTSTYRRRVPSMFLENSSQLLAPSSFTHFFVP